MLLKCVRSCIIGPVLFHTVAHSSLHWELLISNFKCCYIKNMPFLWKKKTGWMNGLLDRLGTSGAIIKEPNVGVCFNFLQGLWKQPEWPIWQDSSDSYSAYGMMANMHTHSTTQGGRRPSACWLAKCIPDEWFFCFSRMPPIHVNGAGSLGSNPILLSPGHVELYERTLFAHLSEGSVSWDITVNTVTNCLSNM